MSSVAQEEGPDEHTIFEGLKEFNTTDQEQNKNLLIRIICSFIDTFGLANCIMTVPAGTIFCRTCSNDPSSGRGYCDNIFSSGERPTYTTFCNVSPLSNIMIQNPSSVNNRVIFLRAKTNLPMLNLNTISQLVGAQIKKGKPESSVESRVYGHGRGFFSACCQVGVMESICDYFGTVGVIQCDEADAYYFSGNSDAELETNLPTNMKSGTELRESVDRLVLKAIQEKRAYPIYARNNQGTIQARDVIGGMFPEFNFHLKKRKYPGGIGEIFDQIYSIYSTKRKTSFLSVYDYTRKGIYQYVGDENALYDICLLYTSDAADE